MVFDSNKEKGNAGLSAAVAYFGMNGYTVSIPLNDTQDYDLIVDDGNKLSRVQVKATNSKRYGGYCCQLRSCGGTNGAVYKTVKETNIDYLFVLCGDKTMYLIPFADIRQSSILNLHKEKSKYAHTDTVDYSKYIVNF